MNNFLESALAIKQEIFDNRIAIHRFAELGFDLPQTMAFVIQKLKEYGYNPQTVGKSGVVCTVGKRGKTILLRADMDALPMREDSGLPFASENGNCHACCHDGHTAMLLGAAKMLKEREGELEGTVKLMFQPAEEILGGAKDMINNGVLENPKVDVALALHVMVGFKDSNVGNIRYSKGAVTNSGDVVRITIKGKDAHGSRPQLGIDAIHIASHIVIALEEIVAREIPTTQDAVVLVGRIEGGTSSNSVAGSAMLELTIRTCGAQERQFLKRRVAEIAKSIAAAFRGEANVEYLFGIPELVNNEELLELFTAYTRDLLSEEKVVEVEKLGGGEDFAMIAEQVPSVYLTLGGGSLEEGYKYVAHHPAMKVNEEALPVGAAVYANCAFRWLQDNHL